MQVVELRLEAVLLVALERERHLVRVAILGVMEIETGRILGRKLDNKAVTLSGYNLLHNLHITSYGLYRELGYLLAAHSVYVHLYSGARSLRTVGVDFVNHHARNRIGLHGRQASRIYLDAIGSLLRHRHERQQQKCQKW